MVFLVVRDLEELLEISIDVRLGCDNTRALDVSNGDSPKKKNADLEYEIIFLKNENKGNTEAYHIKTHQDSDQEYDNLPPYVQAHIRCYNRAKAITSNKLLPRYELMARRLSYKNLYFANWEGVLPTFPYSYMNTAVFLDAAQRRLGFTSQQLWKIDWETFRQIQKYVRSNDYIIIQKILWKDNLSNAVTKMYDNKQSNECDLCGLIDSPLHFMRCEKLHSSNQGKQLF